MRLRFDPNKEDQNREILDIIPERFDSDADSRQARKHAQTRVILTISLGVLAVMALGVAARHILFGEATHERQVSVPVIHADDKPVKIKPQDRGGMDVPNQDKLIYDRMASKAKDQPPERLLPPPEQAQTPPPPPPAVSPSAQPVMIEAERSPPPQAPPPIIKSVEPAAPVVAAALSPVKPAPAPPAVAKPVVAPSPTPMPAPAPVAPSGTAPAAAAPSGKGGGWVVQLVAVKGEAEAKAAWSQLKNAHKDLLSDLSSDIVRVDLGSKGIWWRVRGGPLDEAQARLLCSQLAKQDQGCLIARK